MIETYDEDNGTPEDTVLHEDTVLRGDALLLDPRPETGHLRIDDALKGLDSLDELDIGAHPEVFDTIHGVLRESLANAGRDEGTPDTA